VGIKRCEPEVKGRGTEREETAANQGRGAVESKEEKGGHKSLEGGNKGQNLRLSFGVWGWGNRQIGEKSNGNTAATF